MDFYSENVHHPTSSNLFVLQERVLRSLVYPKGTPKSRWAFFDELNCTAKTYCVPQFFITFY